MATIKGKWVFNESVSSDITETINFTTETAPPSGDKWVAIYCYYDDDDGEREVRFGYSYNGGVSQFPVYGDSWSLQVYRTIDFGTAEQTVSDTFLTWMQANATPEAEPIYNVTITYNDTEIASLTEGQTATVPAGKKAISDISIVFGVKGSITYNGQTTEVEAGKTATLVCAGKKFATDVVVAVEKAADLPPVGTSLEDCTWEQISAISVAGKAAEYFKVGDTKKMTLTDGTAVDMQIVAFDADDKADGSGKAGISWVSKDCVAERVMNSANTNANGWKASDMRTWLRNDFYATLPTKVTDGIVEVQKTYYDKTTDSTLTCNDTVWIPSRYEVAPEISGDTYGREDSGVDYTGFFNSNASRIKNYDGIARNWWLRTADRVGVSGRRFRYISSLGYTDVAGASSSTFYAVLGFCM